MITEEHLRLEARIDHGREVVRGLVDALYGPVTDVDALVERLLHEVRVAADARPADLHRLDVHREIDPRWFQAAGQVGYVAYADRFGGTLRGVGEHLDHLGELGVTYLYLMKVLRAREGANDGGFAVVDFGDVDPALGTRSDLEDLTAHLREHGISLCLDLVMNHTASEHEWARLARAGSTRHRDYYLVFDDRTMPDRYEATLPEVFPEIAPGNFTWDEQLQGWVWTTFNTYQWDLNYANPDVAVEMLRVMLDLANVGVEILRLDAVAFTWKRLGTNCQNQPEAHLIAQLYQALVAMAAPATILKAEAIVGPDELLPYLGAHRQQRDECHLAYHNQLMVMLWSSLATGDAALATRALGSLPPTPPDAAWVNYVRCHDDIGWAVSDADALAVGISPAAHRRFLADFFAGRHPASDAVGAAFSSNPDTGDERTCGTTAALCGLSAARASGDAAAIDRGVRRFQLLHAVMFGFGGIPLVYMGDEVALDNDLSYLADPTMADDSRWMHRPSMPWDVVARRHVAGTVEQRVHDSLVHVSAVRRATTAMSAGGDTWIHQLPDTAVLGWARRHPRHGRFYGLANFADRPATVPAAALGWAGLDEPVEVLGTGQLHRDGDQLVLAPSGVAWFIDARDTVVQPAVPTGLGRA